VFFFCFNLDYFVLVLFAFVVLDVVSNPTLTLLLTLTNHNPYTNLKFLQSISHAGQ